MVEVVEHHHRSLQIVEVQGERRGELVDIGGRCRRQQSIDSDRRTMGGALEDERERGCEHPGVVVLGIESHPERTPGTWSGGPCCECSALAGAGGGDEGHELHTVKCGVDSA